MKLLEGFKHLTETDIAEIMRPPRVCTKPPVKKEKKAPVLPVSQPCQCGCGETISFIPGRGTPKKWASKACKWRANGGKYPSSYTQRTRVSRAKAQP